MSRQTLVQLVLLLSATTVADTVQNFDVAGSAYTLGRHSVGPAASIVAGGPSGNFLRLAAGSSVNTLNTIGFDRTDPGAFCTITLDFDFRITPGSGSADGLGVTLLGTAFHDSAGVVVGAEEPNFAGSLGVGFDVFQNTGELDDNHISVHFDGAVVSVLEVSNVIDLDGTAGQFIHARVVITANAGSGDLTVELTPPGGSAVILIDAVPVPGLRLYEARLQFGARTGGQTADHDLDNINLTYGDCPDVVGQWADAIPLPIIPIHADLLPSGSVLVWDRDDTGDGPGTPHLFDPATELVTPAADPGYDLFCSGHSYLPDGTLFVSGGHDQFDQFGLPYGTIYDGATDSWTTVAQQMNAGRWYPTNTTLANGDTLVVTGTVIPGVVNQLPQVYEVATQTWRDLSSAIRNVPLYAFFHLAPNGMAFNSGPEPTTDYIDTNGSGAWIPVANTGSVHRSDGSSVLYDVGKVLILGGGNPPTRSAQVIDLNVPGPSWSSVDSMAFERRQVNATILADGTVLATGGTGSAGFNVVGGAVFAAELFEPSLARWTTLAAAGVPRIYHSFALLLPDARVLTGGGGHPAGDGPPGDVNHFDVEIYSPPYLFQGARPTITSAPATFGHGDSFFIETPDVVGAVHLIRLAAVTHGFNQNQSISRLAFTPTAQGISVSAPASATEAPPGPYLLFILNNAGVPSVAPIVQLLPDAGSVPAGSLLLDKAAAGEITLSWDPSCTADDFDYAIYEGSLPNFSSRVAQTCTTGGGTNWTFSPAAGGTYYLVVPRNSASEGSYGLDGNGLERGPDLGACLPQSLGACP